MDNDKHHLALLGCLVIMVLSINVQYYILIYLLTGKDILLDSKSDR